MLDFHESIEEGKVGENIFEEDFLNHLNIKYKNVTESLTYQIIDSDYLTIIGTYEIKTNYKDDKFLIIEEYTNINEELGDVRLGWVYKTKADMLVSISKKTRLMIFLPLTKAFFEYYEANKNDYELTKNKVSSNSKNNTTWQSAYRRLPLSFFKGYISCYKKL